MAASSTTARPLRLRGGQLLAARSWASPVTRPRAATGRWPATAASSTTTRRIWVDGRPPPQRAHRRHRGHGRRRRLLARRQGRRHLRLRRRQVLRQPRRPAPRRPGRGHRRRLGHGRLLGGGQRRRHLRLQRTLLRQPGRPTPQRPVVGIAATSNGTGYWEVAKDGGIFNYGTAGFLGSRAASPSTPRWWASRPTRDRRLLGGRQRRGIFDYGAPFLGSRGGQPLDASMVEVAAG